ncbi:MAG: TIM barrel protein [Candidatus Dormibacteraeota bacterium]|nr:TIM barrel protein [Candidatus Dormibacteraeota bacterium]
MPTFAANLSMLWTELPPLERFGAAAEAGFKRVEMLFPHELDSDALASTLQDLDLEMVLFDPAPGDWAGGERGLLCLPGREAEFLQTVRDAIALAPRLGTTKLNALVGLVPVGVSPTQAMATATANLRAAAPLVEAGRVTLLVETINSIDMPGYLADSVDKAVALVESAASPAVRFQLDQYHVAMSGADATEELRRHFPMIGHVQVADVPGRHQPGTGQQPIEAFLAELDALGYAGSVGLEYRPLGTTAESLVWLGGRR